MSVLFILGSHDKLLSGYPTGWYLPEAAHPYYEVSPHYKVDWASVKGGEAPLDQDSVKAFKDDEGCKKFLADEKAQHAVKNTLKVSEVDASKYDAVFVVGGHSPIWENENPQLIKLYSDFWNSGKLVSAVCHGPAGLTEVKDKEGNSIFKGRKATGFTNAEEEQAGKTKEVPYLLETRIKELGGHFEDAGPWKARVVKDGQLLTGQNPQSAEGVGKAIVEHLRSKA